jgi:hypothetical protein
MRSANEINWIEASSPHDAFIRRARSLCPRPDIHVDDPAKRAAFMQALNLICASAVAESCLTHPLHDLVVQIAKESRERTSPPTRKAVLPTHRTELPITGNRAARRAAIRKRQKVAA